MKKSLLVKWLGSGMLLSLFQCYSGSLFAQVGNTPPNHDSAFYSVRFTLERGSHEKDEAVINFKYCYTKDFIDSTGDALKFFNPQINMWWHTIDGYDLVINHYPIPDKIDTLLLGIKGKHEGNYTLSCESVNFPPCLAALIWDTKKNKLIDLRKSPCYSFYYSKESEDSPALRFRLILIPVDIFPVDLHATDSNETLEITWSVTAEINTVAYLTEHSEDGQNYVLIDSLHTIDTCRYAPATYSFQSASPTGTHNYYRIKRRYSSGYINTSAVAQVKKPGPNTSTTTKTTEGIRFFPVPANHVVHLQLPTDLSAQKVMVGLYNNNGKLCYEQLCTKLLAEPFFDIALTSLSPGIYLAKVDYNGQIFSARFIKEN